MARLPEEGFSGRGDSSNPPLLQNSQMDSKLPSIAFNKSELYKLFMTCKVTSVPKSMSTLASLLSAQLMESPLKEFLVANPEVFLKHFEFAFFCYVFGLKNDLVGYKYRPLFTENLCSSSLIGSFQKSLLEFFEEKYDENSLGRQSGYKNSGILKSNLGGNSRGRRSRYDDFTDSDIEEVQRKWGVIVNGDDGCGKNSAIQAFINTFSFEVEPIDLSSSEKMRNVMNQFASAVTMNDVKISLNNIEETARDTDSFFYNSSKTQKATSKQSKQESNAISHFHPISGSIQKSKKSGKRRSTKDEFIVEISDDDKPVLKTPKNTLASFFKKADASAPHIKQPQNPPETSVQNLTAAKKAEKNNSYPSPRINQDPMKPKSRRNQNDPSVVSRLTEDPVDQDLDHSSNKQNIYKPAMFDQDSKNFSSNKGLYWNTRKIYLCRNIELFYANEFVLDRKRGLKKMEEFCMMLEKSNYPFVFIQQNRYNEVFDQAISHFDVLCKQPYSKNEIDLLVYLILFFEINFQRIGQEKATLKEGQLMESGVTYQSLYEESLNHFEEMYQREPIQTPIWQKVVYVNNLLNYNLVKIFSFVELRKSIYTSREWLVGIHRRLLPAESVDYFTIEGKVYFNHRTHLENASEMALSISSPHKPKTTSRLKKIAKIKSEKKSGKKNRDDSEAEGCEIGGPIEPEEVTLEVDIALETDPIFHSNLFKNPALFKASWSLETDHLFLPKETAMVVENDEGLSLLRALDLKLTRASINDTLQHRDKLAFDEMHNPTHPLSREKDMDEYLAIVSKIKEIVREQTEGFNKFSEDWNLDTRLSFPEIEKLKLFAQTPDESFNTAFKTRAQRRQMRELRQNDPTKTLMLIDKFTSDQGQLALLKSYFPYF